MHCKQELSALPREGPLSGVVETSYVEAPLPDPGGAAGEEEGAGSRELAGDHPSALIVVSSSGGGARAGPVSYTHLTLPTKQVQCRSRWSPYH